jgi:hypothetical protein
MALVGHMLGCSGISKLRKLSSNLLSDRSGDSYPAFVTMLQRLSDLESLSMLGCPQPDLWRQVHAAGGHKKLKELGIAYSEPEVEDLEGFVSACNQDFPVLQQLKIHFVNMDDLEVEEVVQALAPLRTHPCLSSVKCGWNDRFSKESFLRDCREALGEGIEIVEIPDLAE